MAKRQTKMYRWWRRYAGHSMHAERAWLATLLFAVLGFALVRAGHAATYASGSEAEAGAITGTATPFNDAAASKGSAVGFGMALKAPTGLQSFAGGTNLALHWNPTAMPAGSTAVISQYVIFRDGSKVGSIDPRKANTDYPDYYNCGFLDSSITAGKGYTYQLQAQATDGRVSPLSPVLSVTVPTASQPVPTINLDTSQAGDIANTMQTAILPFIRSWYPKVANQMSYPFYTSPTSLTFRADPGLPAYAYSYDQPHKTITFNPKIIRDYPTDRALWFTTLGYLAEDWNSTSLDQRAAIASGTVSWLQNFVGHMVPPQRPYLASSGLIDDSWMLQYGSSKHDGDFIHKMNAAGFNGTYKDSLFQTYTGKTYQQLGAEAAQAEAVVSGNGHITDAKGRCLSTAGNSLADSTAGQVATCTTAVKWTVSYRSPTRDATMPIILNLNGTTAECLTVEYGATSDGTAALLNRCSQAAAYSWAHNAQGQLVDLNSGKCLDVSGSQLIINTCSSAASQQWTLPT